MCGPWGFGKANDAEANYVVKVTYIVQRVGSRVNAIGQQAGDALKNKGRERVMDQACPLLPCVPTELPQDGPKSWRVF